MTAQGFDPWKGMTIEEDGDELGATLEVIQQDDVDHLRVMDGIPQRDDENEGNSIVIVNGGWGDMHDPNFGQDAAVVPVVDVVLNLRAQSDSVATMVANLIEAYLDADWNEAKSAQDCGIDACRDLLGAAHGALRRLEGR